MKLLAGILAFVVLLGPAQAFAAGGGGMSSPSVSQPQPRKTPEQLAIASYNQGISARDKAHEFEQELADADERAAKKLRKKISRQYKKAVKRFRSVVKHEPRLYQGHGSLGYALKQLGEFEEAMASYGEALRLKPGYTPAIEYRAEAYLGVGRFDEVIEAHGILAAKDKGHQRELEVAISSWLAANERSGENAAFHDWATGLQ